MIYHVSDANLSGSQPTKAGRFDKSRGSIIPNTEKVQGLLFISRCIIARINYKYPTEISYFAWQVSYVNAVKYKIAFVVFVRAPIVSFYVKAFRN